MQLAVVEGEQLFSNDVEAGRVVTQTPPPDTAVERGATITIQLSKGPDVVPFPDLTGQTYAAGAGDARRCRLRGQQPARHHRRHLRVATIAGEPVEPGELFLRGTAVDLVFL